MRLYGLFRRDPSTRKWVRECPALSFPKEAAIRAFQNRLLDGSMCGYEMALRPVS